jgi:hypothetical protein
MTLLCKPGASAQIAPVSPWAPDSAITPQLKFARSNDHITLSWKLSPFEFGLSARHSLPGTNQMSLWQKQQTFVEGEANVTLQMTNTQEFFKLTKTGWDFGAVRPLFEFGVFYGVSLQIGNGQPMTITGPVHVNGNAYIDPDSELVFGQQVTATGGIYFGRSPEDGRPGPYGTVQYLGGRASNVVSLVMNIGTNNTPVNLREILNPSPVGESTNSLMGRHRYFNQADLIITMTSTGATATTGVPFGRNFTLHTSHVNRFLSTNETFTDARENKLVHPMNIDIGKLREWVLTNTFRFGGRYASSIYMLDQRTMPSNHLAAVRVKNGRRLPPSGLTIATARPLYVWGDYNQNFVGHLGTTNTASTFPASLAADAITILSPNWLDARSTEDLTARVASPITVNAALLSGIVENSTTGSGGGVANFPRLLEAWGGNVTFTYNGAMAVLFASQYAVGPWGGPNVYDPPVRNWNLDQNFRNPAKLPPLSPLVGVLAPAE